MNSLPKLAVLIYDDKLDFNRTIFIECLKKHITNFDARFYFLGIQSNYLHYSKEFENLNCVENFKQKIVEFYFNNFDSFDYFLYLSPEIIIKSDIDEINFRFDKINFLKNDDFLIFLSKNNHLIFNYYLSETNNKFLLNFGNLPYSSNYNYLNTNFKFSKNKDLIEKHKNKIPLNVKKIAVVFTGISHDNEGEIESGWSVKYSRSFKSCYMNHFEKIINPLFEFLEVKTFITTYYSDAEEELKKVYSPFMIDLLEINNSSMRKTYIKSIDNLINNAKDIDFFICTRFDIKFYDKFTSWNIDYNKFNILYVESWGGNDIENSPEEIAVCDVLFAFPKVFLKSFGEAIRRNEKKPKSTICKSDLHYIYFHLSNLIGKNNIHFVSITKQSTANSVGFEQKSNSFFYLCRYELKK